MDRRQQKRWAREHRRAAPHRQQWLFHKAQWGDLVVSVMPLSTSRGVIDSNTGLVLEAPYHRSMRAQLVVNNGRMPVCDARALNDLICPGEGGEAWAKHVEVYTIPTYRVQPEEINDVWREAIEVLSKHMPRARAEANLEQTLGWCTDSVSCAVCMLTIPGHWVSHVVEQARAFGWGLDANDKAVCPAHEMVKPFPTLAEVEAAEMSPPANGARR